MSRPADYCLDLPGHAPEDIIVDHPDDDRVAVVEWCQRCGQILSTRTEH